MQNPLRLPRETAFERPRVVRTCGDINILICKRASRRNGVQFFDISTSKSAPNLLCFVHFGLRNVLRQSGVHFFDISTSKSAPNLLCFVHFDLEMCFAAPHGSDVHFFDIATSKSAVFFSFFTCKCARAAAVCNLSSLICPDGSAPAALAILFFDPPLEKHNGSRLSYLFAHLHLPSSHSSSSLIFFLLLFSSLTRPISAFYLSILVGSLTSKLPSIICLSRCF